MAHVPFVKDDLIEGLASFINTSDDVTEPINLGNQAEFTIGEPAEMALDITGSKSKIVLRALPRDDPRRRRPDIAEAGRVLGWRPSVPLREGLERITRYFERLQQS